ncbi:MAG: putative ABC exporter domain-containing protein, partial [Chloroflexi bacterium]|nr:putative ABC exporter domain-containing protein [Chloroflexota bacterium]
SQLTSFPALTLVLQGVLYRWLFGGNADAYLLAMHTLLPVAAFWVLFLIYRRYVAESWALLLAFWGVTFYRNFSSLGYWLKLVTGRGGFIEAASLSPLELSRTPAPALTFLLFIVTFYLCTRDNKPTPQKMALYSGLWALQLYVYLFNFIAGVLFWLAYLVFTCYLQDKGIKPGRVARVLLLNMGVILAVVSPLLARQLFFTTPLDWEVWQRMGMIAASAGPITSEWGFLLAYALPLAVVLLVTWVASADYYELVYRFAPVFLMILVEIVVLNLHLILGQFFQPYLFSVRIGNFFSRYLYFIPIIYFISHPRKTRFHRRGRLSQAITPVYEAAASLVVRWRRAIALAGMGLIAVVVVASSLKYAGNHAGRVGPQMVATMARFEALAQGRPAGELVASEDIAVNLLLPVLSDQETLLVSSFNNYVPEEEILERLLLFAHIFNWGEAQFLAFMRPSPRFTTFYTDNDFILSPEVLQNGFGYWLLNHHREMGTAELAAYEAMLAERFGQFDVRAAVAAYGVTAVQAAGPINLLLAVESERAAGDMVIYQLETKE